MDERQLVCYPRRHLLAKEQCLLRSSNFFPLKNASQIPLITINRETPPNIPCSQGPLMYICSQGTLNTNYTRIKTSIYGIQSLIRTLFHAVYFHLQLSRKPANGEY